jgi:hypothetical protein
MTITITGVGGDLMSGWNFTSTPGGAWTAFSGGSVIATNIFDTDGGGGIRANSASILTTGKTYLVVVAGTQPSASTRVHSNTAGAAYPGLETSDATFSMTGAFVADEGFFILYRTGVAGTQTTITDLQLYLLNP